MADLTRLGKKAENKFKEWTNRPEDGLLCYRLPDQMTGMFGSTNPCDFFVYRTPYFYAIECKATYEDRFDFSMITPGQHKGLLDFSVIDGVTSYVCILFASYQRAFLIDIRDIKSLEDSGTKSLNIKKLNKWETPYIEIRTLPSRKQLLDYDPSQADEIFGGNQ